MEEKTTQEQNHIENKFSDEEIRKFLPFLRQTNPHLNEEELKELARKMLSSPQKVDDIDTEKSLSDLFGHEEEEKE